MGQAVEACPGDLSTVLACSIGKGRVQALCAHNAGDAVDQLSGVLREAKTSKKLWSTSVLNVHIDRWSSGAANGLTLSAAVDDSIFVIEVGPFDEGIEWVEHRIGSKTMKREKCVARDDPPIDETYSLSLPFATTGSQTEGGLAAGLIGFLSKRNDATPPYNEAFLAETEEAPCKSEEQPSTDVLRAKVVSVLKGRSALHFCRAYLGNRQTRGVPAVFLDGSIGSCLAIVDCGADGVFRKRVNLGAASAAIAIDATSAKH